MTTKKIVILLNLILAVLLGVLLIRSLEALDNVRATPVTLDPIPLDGLSKAAPARIKSLKNLFGLKDPKAAEKPPAAPPPVQEVQVPTHIVRLEGIMIAGPKQVAVVLLSVKGGAKGAAPERRKLQSGDVLFDFSVQRVDNDRVFLLNRATNATVELVIFKANTLEG